MRKQLSWIASLAALAVMTTVPAAATAGATTTPVSESVSGTQTVVDESAGTYAMHGSLVGTWQITKFVPRYQSASQIVATGREMFTGCLDSNKNGACDKKEPTGSLKFKFMYWASFDPGTGALLHGECVHPVVGGSGSFRHAAGVIFMEDTPAGAEVITTYTGTIEYRASKSTQTSKHRSLAAASNLGPHGGGCGS